MIEYFAALAISYILGYGTHWYAAPEKICKEIRYEIPKELYAGRLSARICPEGIDKNGMYVECYPGEKLKYAILPGNWQSLEEIMINQSIFLEGCVDILEEYNKDKFIMK